MNAYYDSNDLNRFAEVGNCASPLWEKFSAYYGADSMRASRRY